MVRAKNCETLSTFFKVMQKKLLPLFFRTRCIWCCIVLRCTVIRAILRQLCDICFSGILRASVIVILGYISHCSVLVAI